MEKKELRKKIRHSLQKMSHESYMKSSFDIKNTLLKEPSLIEGNTIAITISRKPEVDTFQIIEDLWKLRKTVVVPKCDPTLRTMDFYAISNFEQLQNVYMDLKEPIPELTVLIEPEQIDCMIVPGIVFDKNGYRIGYGGGFYDRYLQNFRGSLLSLAFDLQVVHDVPTEDHDLPVNIIITEKTRIDCKTHRKESLR